MQQFAPGPLRKDWSSRRLHEKPMGDGHDDDGSTCAGRTEKHAFTNGATVPLPIALLKNFCRDGAVAAAATVWRSGERGTSDEADHGWRFCEVLRR